MTPQYSNTSGIPLSIAVFLATDHYDHNDDPLTISATTLIKPLRQIILSARVPEGDAMMDLASMMQSRIGTAIHSGIEIAWADPDLRDAALAALNIPKRVRQLVRVNPTADEVAANPDIIPVYMEQRLSKKVGKWTVSGKFDFVGQGRLEDFKSTTSYVVTNHTNDDKFSWQGSIYRWMGEHIITRDEMAIQFIIRDWSAARVKQDPNYPPNMYHERIIPLRSVQETDLFVKKKLAMIEKYWDAPEDEIPACTNDELARSEPVFKYYSDPTKMHSGGRSTKNFDDKATAYLHLNNAGKGAIKEVPGSVTACRYCSAFAVCTQKDALVAAGDLTL